MHIRQRSGMGVDENSSNKSTNLRKRGQAWRTVRSSLRLERGLVAGLPGWGWLTEGQECQAKELVYQRLVFMAAACGRVMVHRTRVPRHGDS